MREYTFIILLGKTVFVLHSVNLNAYIVYLGMANDDSDYTQSWSLLFTNKTMYVEGVAMSLLMLTASLFSSDVQLATSHVPRPSPKSGRGSGVLSNIFCHMGN